MFLSLIPSVMSECVGVVDISCGGSACVALMSDNSSYAWGDSVKGGAVPSSVDLTNIVDISCGADACVARTNDGDAYAWGNPDKGGAVPSSVDLTNIADIS